MKNAVLFCLFFTLAAGVNSAGRDPLMGSVVKSDKWKMDRKNNLEFFDGAVSFTNPSYTMRSDHAVYNHTARLWDIYGSAYILRKFQDSSKIEINCEKGKYFEAGQTALFERGSRQIRMKYYAPDARELHGFSDKAKGEKGPGLMSFEGDFSLKTENLYMLSQKGLYRDLDKSFLMYESTPVAVGTKEGYDFAVTAEEIKFFRDSRDIKFYNNVSGWIKDIGVSE